MWQFAIEQFEFNVGDAERHRVVFRFNQSIGNLRISVDGVPVIRRFEMLSLKMTKRYEFQVGQSEQHNVLIEKTRKRLLGGVLPQECVVSVDGKEVARYGQSSYLD
jgi:hypothetical protein